MRFSATLIPTLLAAMTIPAGLAWAQPQDANFTQTTYAGGVGGITDLAWASDGTNNYLFFIQQNGAIRVVRNGTLQSASVGMVSPVVNSGEMGLLGLAIDPSFSSNRRIFVFVTETGSVQRIYRYTTTDSSGTVGLTGTRAQMGVDMPANNANHDGGALAFGPDGNLYFGVGNNGNGINTGGNYLPPDNVTNPNPNELMTLGSKIGRMTSSGAPVASNPYYTGGGGARDYIWSRGWRNPFGICFQPGTASPWVLEVGDSWEHIFLAASGSNRGWPTENNSSTTNGKLIARFRYQRDNGTNWAAAGGCLTKGCFYTGSSFPAAYQGNLFFAEYKGGKLVRVIPNGTGTIPSGNVSLFVNNVGGIIDVETGPDGALYYASRNDSAIYRLQYSSGTTQNIVLSTSTLNVNEGSTNTFTVRLAAAPAANVIVNVVRTGDADVTVQSGGMLTFTTANWSTPQTVTIAAAQDADTTNGGATITASSTGLTSRTVAVTEIDNDTVNGAPTASISSPLNGATVSGTNAEFYGDGNDPEGKPTLVRAEFYIDDVLYYTDTTPGGHYHIGGDHARWNTTGLSKGSHTLKMTVYDNGGLSGSAQVTVNVDNSDGSDGLLAKYYDDMTMSHLVLTRVDPGVNFDWGTGSPHPSLPVNGFSVRWTGKITPTYSETYTFYARTDDGVRLEVKGTSVIDNWIDKGPDPESTGTIALTAGQPVSIVMEYYENGGGAVAHLSWSSASQAKGLISSNAMGNVVVGGGGDDGGGGRRFCGLTGLELLIVLGLAAVYRRRRL